MGRQRLTLFDYLREGEVINGIADDLHEAG
jgi:hypothetical protein